ncbi:PLP-dependent aminotransferase family protein [Paenibacillus sp. P26]|nr:PLP-dependent aminotransferase family protein [Paenibacillus sp. P26]
MFWERMREASANTGTLRGNTGARLVLSDYLRKARGVVCSPEQIVIGAGISYSFGLLTKLLAGIRHVAVEEPGFAPVRKHFTLNGFELVSVPVHEKGLSLEELERSPAQAVYLTPSHQFPTGGVMPYAEREHLLRWADERNAYIIEDDYDGEFRYFGKPIPSLQSLDRNGRVIYIGTFSKAFTPALRMNYMVLPADLPDRLQSLHHLLMSPSRIDQLAMQRFIEEGHWYRHIRRMRNAYRKKHGRLIELLQVHFGNHIDITGHSAGLHIQVTVRTRSSAEELLERAAAEGVRIYDLRHTWVSPQRSGYPKVYLGFGGITEADMETGVRSLSKAWSGLLEEAPERPL